MTHLKSYTSLEQSKVLAKILPLESADMLYSMINGYNTPFIRIETIEEIGEDDVLCWSLAALMDAIPSSVELVKDGSYWVDWESVSSVPTISSREYDNPVDACYAMILKLHKLNLL